MKNQFVTFEIALKLKELGFKEYCFSAYRNYDGEEELLSLLKWKNGETYDNHEEWCAAPLYQQVIEWFREKHNIIIEVWYDETQKDGFPWLIEIYNNDICLSIDDKDFGSYFDNYNEAREFLILKAIKEIKKYK